MSVQSNYPFVSRGEYNGKGMFTMSSVEEGEQRNKFNTFQFGIEKAKAILEHVAALEAFVESDGARIKKGGSSTKEKKPLKKRKTAAAE